MKILIVDDHKIHRQVLAKFLKNELSADVLEGTNGLEGIQIFTQKEIDIVITDLNMPKMDGIVMSKELKKINPDTPIIALSMADDSISIKKMIAAGAKSYILKGCDTKELLEAIDRALKGEEYFQPSVSKKILSSQLK